MKYSVLIVEDDELASALIQKNLSFYPDFELIVTVNTIKDAIAFITNNIVDVVFLDVELPDGKGFDVMPYLLGNPAVIIITSNEAYALAAFDNGVLDFFKKSIIPNRFKISMGKIEIFLKNRASMPSTSVETPFLFVKSGLKHIKVQIDDIVFIESINEYANVYLVDKKSILTNISLKSLLVKLQNYGFAQVHRSYIVNFKHINYVDDGLIILDNAKEIPLGKTFKSDILKLFK